MRLTQNWVGYLDRSYEQIKKSVISRLIKNVPEITDHSESNLMTILISIFSGIGEMLNYYIDSYTREAFLGVAQKYTSVVRLVKLIDYRIKARAYPTVDLLFTSTDGVNIIPTPNPIFIPKGTQVSDVNGLVFLTTEERTLALGQSGVYVPAAQYQEVVLVQLGVSDGTNSQKFVLPINYVHDSLKITINNTVWRLYTSLGQLRNTTQGYIVDIEEDGNAYVIFGDGLNGAVPGINQIIYGTYLITEGSRGNSQPNTIVNILSNVSVPQGITLKVNNPDYANGGSDFETLEEIRNRAPRHIRTLERAVTYQDYIDVTLQVPGVGSAEVSYCCGKYVDVYVVPNTRGTSTLALLDRVKAHLNCRKMITTKVAVRSSGISKIWIKAKIYGMPLFDNNAILIPVINALDEEYGFNKIQVNRLIAISDIIGVIENVQQVDRVEIEQIRVLPFARPSETTNSLLNIEFLSLPVSNTRIKYTLIYQAISNSFQLYKETFFLGLLAVDQIYNDGIVHFKVGSGSYSNSNKWEFFVTPSYPEIFPSGTIQIKDYTAPIVDVDPLVDDNTPRGIFSELEIVTQGVSTNCLPPCA